MNDKNLSFYLDKRGNIIMNFQNYAEVNFDWIIEVIRNIQYFKLIQIRVVLLVAILFCYLQNIDANSSTAATFNTKGEDGIISE